MKLALTFINPNLPDSRSHRRLETLDFPPLIISDGLSAETMYSRYINWYHQEGHKALSAGARAEAQQRHFVHNLYLEECKEVGATLKVEVLE